MSRHVKRHGSDGFADLLRREAARDELQFSQALHERILRRLPRKAGVPGVIQVGEPRPQGAGRSAWLQRGMATVAAAAMAIAILSTRTDRAGGPLPPVALIAVDPTAQASESVGDGVPADAASAGIDTVPTFDQLEAGVREGVSNLAATLLDVPEWRMLADFDAAGFLGADAAP